MLYNKMEKTIPGNTFACGLFLVLVFHTFEVLGTFTSNGLSESGAHVCKDVKSRHVSYYRAVATIDYTTYYTKCGLFGWHRCKRSRQKTVYRSRIAYTTGYDTLLYCCSGWEKVGNECTKAICSPACNNGGTCTSPNSCSCRDGWTGSDCSEDIDDCSPNNGGCEQICVNRRGRERICACRQGYTQNGAKCLDLDECLTGHACSCAITGSGNVCGARCTNTRGGFRCSCGRGYSLVQSTVCRDNNECAVNYGGCSHLCVNYPGGYKCTCRRGFRLANDKLCEDVNECNTNNGNCEHICLNSYGSHRCKCKQGFMLDSNRRTCSDVDECKSGHHMHGCEDYCTNTLGGYFCSCRKGYQLMKNNRTCTDIDECAPRKIAGSNETATRSACHHICSNVDGSFLCSCRNGYALMYDKKQCKDIDECQSGKHSCEHYCHNTDGSYRCTCKEGYKLSPDGKTCEAQPCEEIDPPWQGGITCSGKVTGASCTFSCNPGYDLVGSQSRTCLPSSSWSGNQTLCKAKHCEKLTTKHETETLSVPCFTSLGSTCYFGCRRGFVLQGDGQANCSLNLGGEGVSWKIGQFNCEEVRTCRPNPCRHEGKCLALDASSFVCNCEETGYKGNLCEVGFVTTPIYPKLRPNVLSKALPVLARPSKRLRVSLTSEDGVTFNPPSIEIQFPKRKETFTVEAARPGIRAVSYNLEGDNKDDFETPERSAVFVAPEISNRDPKPFLIKGELPVGCEKHQTTENVSCELRLLSTAPWTGTPRSTHGIVHFLTGNNQTIPLSLIGLNLKQLQLSRDTIIETGITRTSTSKKFSLLYQRNGKCYSKVADSNNLLELIENDAFVSSFMYALSALAPEWLTLAVSETNQHFDIQNIAANLASDLEHCSGSPLNGAFSLAYYRPAVNYKIRVAQDEVLLFADGRTCFAINVCKPGLFISFSRKQAELLKSTLNVFRDMKDSCGLDLVVDSIGFLSNEESTHFVKGMIWNGMNLQKLSPLWYNVWLKGSVDWRIEVPKLLFVTFKMTGETIIKSRNIDVLFTDRMSQRMEMQFKGKAFVNITGRALKKDFVVELDSSEIDGKAVLGGRTTCSKSVQGIFITLKTSARNLLNHSPLSAYILPIKTEPVRLALLVSLSGGRQNKILNIRSLKLFLKDLSILTPKVQNFFQRANSVLPQVKDIIEGPLEMTQKLNDFVQEMEILLASERINMARALVLLNQINSDIEYLKKVVDLITPMTFSSNDFSLLRMIFEIQPANFPTFFHVNLGGEHVASSLQGISFYLRTDLCVGQLCFNDLTTTLDYLAERNCFPNVPYLSMFHAKGNILKTMSLSDGNILTLTKGQIINMVFPRDSDMVTAHFVGDIQLLGANQSVNVTLDKKQLSFQMHAKIFNKYAADMKVTAETYHVLEWKSLSFTVEGKMMNSSLLSTSLQARVTKFARYLAQKAAKRVQNCKRNLLLATQRVDSTKELVKEKTLSLNKADVEKNEKEWQLQNIYNNYKNQKTSLNSTLTQLLELKNNETCDIQNCSYIVTNTCIPAVCQEKVFVNYTVPNCKKQERNVVVQELVQVQKQEFEEVQTYKVIHHSNCGGSTTVAAVGAAISTAGAVVTAANPIVGAIVYGVGWLTSLAGALSDSIFGCDSYTEKVAVGKINVTYNVKKNEIRSKTVRIEEFKCGKPKMESVISSYTEPRKCCKHEVSGKIKVLDPNCVSHNLDCLNSMSLLKKRIKSENENLFDEFQSMRNKGEEATIAQLEANKARVKFDLATKQLELARARLKQYEFAKESINLTTVTLREKLGLNIGEKMKNLGDQALVSVGSLVFSVSLTKSSAKKRLPLTAYVRTFEDSDKAIQLSMDFRRENDSLASASKLIVENLFETFHSRRRRSAKQELVESKINGSSFSLEQHECLFSYEAHIFFADIVESLDSAIKSKKELEDTMSAGTKDLEKLVGVEDNSDDLSSGARQQIRTSYSDIIQSVKDAQVNSSAVNSWENTLEDIRGFLDVLSQEKNFTECSGIQDCTDFFFDSLEEMYEMEYHPRAIEIKTMLKSLHNIISSMLEENHEMSTLEDMISQAKLLINNSSDDIILCGKKPEMERNSPVEVVAILGETVNLVCEAKSTLEVEYLWIKNDQPLEDTNTTTLELRNVTKRSEGVYKCQASNKRGDIMSNVTIVEVHQRPKITEQPLDAQALVGDETFSLVCNSTGIPRPLTEWFFIPIKAEKHKAVRVNTTGSVLWMSNLTTADAGFYYCNVSNLHGAVNSRLARLDVSRFVPGEPRIAVSLKLKRCGSESPVSHYRENASTQSQQVESAAFEYITQKMLERVNWPVGKIESKHYNPFPDASISFVVSGDESSILEGKELEALYSFSLSRRRIGNSLKKLYLSLEDESMKFKLKNLTISADKESLGFGFLPQRCPNGTRRHENGFLCVYCLPGYYGVINRTCIQCPVGTYQPGEGSIECIKCPFRVSYTEPGAVRESQCVDISIPCVPPVVDTKYVQAPNEMKNLYRSGETIVLGCKPGYRVVGNGTRECNEGNWTKMDFYCEKTCFPPWTELHQRCYLVVESPTHRWKDAAAKCMKLKSHMLTISSKEENEFTGKLAKAYVEEKKMGQVQMWLGLRKLHAGGQFQWVDGSRLEGYTNWTPGEPNNANGRELCTEMLVSKKDWLNKWNDVECDTTGYKSITVCEKPLREGD